MTKLKTGSKSLGSVLLQQHHETYLQKFGRMHIAWKSRSLLVMSLALKVPV